MQDTLDFIKKKTNNFVPEIALILGSGLGDFAKNLEGVRLKYADIPNFGTSSVKGHSNQLLFTNLAGKNVVIMQGRFHFYEGYPVDQVVFPIKVFARLGVKKLVVTNAAGLTHKDYAPGTLMLITDHINQTGVDPLRGKNDDTLGPRFPDMSEVYKKYLMEIAKKSAKNLGINLAEGIYCARSGPSYETPAEIRMLRLAGVDAVGMSTVPEAVVANYCGMDVLGISCLTNYASGVSLTKLSHQEVIDVAKKVQQKFEALILDIIEHI